MGPIDVSTPVLVLGARYGGLGVARSLGRLGVPVYAVDELRRSPATHSRYWRRVFSWRFSQPAGRTLDFLRATGRALGSKVLLIATGDQTIGFVADQAAALRESFVFPDVPAHMVHGLMDKRALAALAASAGVPAPRAVFLDAAGEIDRFVEKALFPIMLKSLDSLRPPGRLNVIIPDRDTLRRQLQALDEEAKGNVMLQEYIPGQDDSVWMFNGYFDRSGGCAVAFTGQKLRQWPPYHGVTSLGVCTPNAAVEALTIKFLRTLRYRGMVDVGYRFDARDGLYKILDVNPRLGATFRLFVDSAGLDVARAFYLDMTGQPVPVARPVPGRRWWLEEDLFSARDYVRDGYLTWEGWLRSLRGVREAAWFAIDDPAPVGAWLFHRLGGSLGSSKMRR